MSEMLFDGGVREILERMTADGTTAVTVVNPSPTTVASVVDALDPADDRTVNVLARESVLKDVTDDFIVASAIADLEEADVLALRSGVQNAENAIMVTEGLVVALIARGEDVVGIGTGEDAFVGDLHARTADQWRRGSAFSHRTPPKTRVAETLSEEIGDDVWGDFASMLDALGTARGDGEGLDEVDVSLLVAARNGVLLYDISKWGEDVGLASKATFSRTKTRLEEAGLIDTEKVPIEVGRPRLRLVLGDETLKQASIDELANGALARLSEQ